jgi:hypothetical protein
MPMYNSKDLGVVVNKENEAIGTYQHPEFIPMRKEWWYRFALDVTLVASKVKIKARASAATSGHSDATPTLLDIAEITTSGYYEMKLHASSAYDLELEWVTSNATNKTIIAVMLTRDV